MLTIDIGTTLVRDMGKHVGYPQKWFNQIPEFGPIGDTRPSHYHSVTGKVIDVKFGGGLTVETESGEIYDISEFALSSEIWRVA